MATDVIKAINLLLPKLKEYEGFRSHPYLDSVKVPTIGYGTTRYPNGKSVTLQDKEITEDVATTYMVHDMNTKISDILLHLVEEPTNHQLAAMLSLTYNIGVSPFISSSVLSRFNNGDTKGAADAFLMWDKGHVDGKLVVIPGLHNRRLQEKELFLTND